MSEKINSEEILDSVSEDTEKTVLADEDEITAAVDNDTENTMIADDDSVSEETVDISSESELNESPKKKPFLQLPVIIACCIVLLAIIGFLAYMAFFLKEPENVTWSSVNNDITYYYEFKSDGTFTGYLGTIEVTGSFQKAAGEDGKTITVDTSFGNFVQNTPATYTISGSRLFGNQELNGSYTEDYTFTLTQAKRDKNLLELPKDFTPDEELVGSWVFKYMGYEIYKATFNDNGSMSIEFVQEKAKYNGIYTLEDGKINFTFYANESIATPMDYKVDGDYLTFMGYKFVRVGSDAENATPDQQSIFSQATQDSAAAEATEAVEAE